MRKLLILMSLNHASWKQMGLSYHKETVKLAERMIEKARATI